jgi:seryl-tRNA synthetase
MLTASFIRENRDLVVNRLKIKNFHDSRMIDKIIETDNKRRAIQAQTDIKQAELNNYSKEIGNLMKAGNQQEAGILKNRMTRLKEEIRASQQHHNDIITSLNDLLIQIPNIPHELVPAGKGEQDNQLIRQGGKMPEHRKDLMPHWDLIKKYDIIDFELGIKGRVQYYSVLLSPSFWMRTSGPVTRNFCLRCW